MLLFLFLMAGCKATDGTQERSIYISPDCAVLNTFSDNTVPVVRSGDALPTPAVSITEVGGLAGPVPSPSRLDELVSHFYSLMFDTECNGERHLVLKWSQDIYIKSGPAHDVPSRLNAITPVLEALTGIKFNLIISRKRANIEIFEEPAYPFDCFVLYQNKPDGSFDSAQIQMGKNYPASERTECLLEELSQILGPFNDVTTIKDTLWRPLELKTYHSLTWSDAVILRTLYDARIRPGMHRDVAMPIVRVIIGELLVELNR